MVIFSDVDGVLNQLQLYKLDSKCIDCLSILCKHYNADVVLTSSWRFGYLRDYNKCSPQVKQLIDALKVHDIKIIGRTKDLKNRYLEVHTYIKENDIDKYIILDDDKSEFSTLDKNLYVVNFKTGLTSKDVGKIKKLFKG